MGDNNDKSKDGVFQKMIGGQQEYSLNSYVVNSIVVKLLLYNEYSIHSRLSPYSVNYW